MKKRWLTEHEISYPTVTLEVAAVDETGAGGVSHYYEILWLGKTLATINFQLGPIVAGHPNGVSHEALIAIVLDRLRGFQGIGPPDPGGNLPCRENEMAITKLEEALMWLHHSTRDRMKREIETTRKL